VALQWLSKIRSFPKLNPDELRRALWVGFFHGGGQLTTVLSLGAGAVSFTHIVKSAEPLFSALVSALCFGQIFKPQVYLTLIPIVGGVAVACAKEINFNVTSFVAAMVSNAFFGLRSNFSKSLMQNNKRSMDIHPANLFGIVTILGFLICLPLALILEHGAVFSVWKDASNALSSNFDHPSLILVGNLILSGLTHYMNNEVMYLALGSVHPVTLAVGNTIKRIFLILVGMIVFNDRITLLGGVGSVVAIVGVQLYSIARQKYA